MSLWQQAFRHEGHLSNGLCPDFDPPGLDSRDPECFYCRVMSFIETAQEASRQHMDGTQCLVYHENASCLFSELVKQ